MRTWFWLGMGVFYWSMVQGQSVILIPPLPTWSSTHTPLINYQSDTAYFNTPAVWQGLVYADFPAGTSTEDQILELLLENKQGRQEMISVQLQAQRGADLLNWHPSLTKTLPMIQGAHTPWYTFELAPNHHLRTAYDLVNLGRVLQPTVDATSWQDLTYRPLGSERQQHLRVKLDRKATPWAAFWQQYDHFEGLATQLEGIQLQQESLKRNCSPASFEQVQEWAAQQSNMRNEKITADVNLVVAVEQLKIITETLPESTPTYLKRDLHALLLLDIALLQQPKPAEKAHLLQRKADALRQLSLYPTLKKPLQAYTQTTAQTAQCERQQASRRAALQRIEQQFGPYRSLHQRYQMLEEKANYLDQQLKQAPNQ